jgi:NADH:ubiquinone oxidoreductase subunit F (NADH-binding)
MTAYSDLVESARRRLDARTAGKTRVLVQVGQCSRAVGAGAVSDALALAMEGRTDAYLTIAGCDGSCFAAPQVIITGPSGQSRRYQRLSPADVPALTRTLDIWSVQPREARSSPNLPDDLSDFFAFQSRLLLTRCGQTGPESADEYLAAGGYSGLDRALSLPPGDVIQTVLDAGLLGRGGAFFPAALKWKAARNAKGSSPYLVVNAEEGEPGIFKDRHILEGDPHLLLEGMLIAAYAAGTGSGYIYVNAEADLSAERLEAAIVEAQNSGLIGKDILGSGFDFQVTVRRGAGGYVCGEETTLLDTIQGNRREPRLRPPFPTESGLFQQPTVINNVETLSNVPLIFAASDGEGDAEASHSFASLGLENARGTKLVSLSGAVMRPGMAEVPMGTTLREVIYGIGGGLPPGRKIGVIAVGGPSSGVVPSTELDMQLRPGMLHPSGVVMGAGGIVVLDDSVPVIDVVRRLAAYNAAESCGKCTPCREGTPRIVEALDRLNSDAGTAADIEELKSLAEIVGSASLCGLGQMAGGPVNSALHFFPDDLTALARIN